VPLACVLRLARLDDPAQLPPAPALTPSSAPSPPQMIYRFSELHDPHAYAPSQVTRLCFSPDDQFLAGSNDAPAATLCVWDMPTGSVAAAQKQKAPLSFLIWGPVLASERKVRCRGACTVGTAGAMAGRGAGVCGCGGEGVPRCQKRCRRSF
jgi:hypothetical protein